MNRELWLNRRDYFAEMLREEAADEDRWVASHQHKPAARLEWAANDAATLRALADQIAALQGRPPSRPAATPDPQETTP